MNYFFIWSCIAYKLTVRRALSVLLIFLSFFIILFCLLTINTLAQAAKVMKLHKNIIPFTIKHYFKFHNKSHNLFSHQYIYQQYNLYKYMLLNTTCMNILPYLGLYNAQDFAQILYFVGGVRIINSNNVFHSFPDREITCLPCFFVYYCQHAKLNISSYENTNKTQHI